MKNLFLTLHSSFFTLHSSLTKSVSELQSVGAAFHHDGFRAVDFLFLILHSLFFILHSLSQFLNFSPSALRSTTMGFVRSTSWASSFFDKSLSR